MSEQDDLIHLRAAIAAAWRAREHGNHPFGAVLVDGSGRQVLEAENSVMTERDPTGHAETNLVRLAARAYDAATLAGCTLYTSTEPCPMCAGAIYWSNIGRVVYALSEERLQALTEANPNNEFLLLHCRDVLERGQRAVAVAGPLIEDEAVAVHEGFWS